MKLPLSAVLLLSAVAAGCGGIEPGASSLDAAGESADAGAGDSSTELADGAVSPAIDAGVDAGVAADAGPSLPPRYPGGVAHSPINASVASNLRAIVARGPTLNGFELSKIGDSNTVSKNFLNCFAGSTVDLAGRTSLQATIDHFKLGTAGGTTAWDRTSQCATIGWSAWSALAGAPTPLEQEHDAIHPRFAVVMFGTNDVQARNLERFTGNLFDIADFLVARGTVPIFSAIPPRDDDATADLWVPRYNAVTRAIAQARQLPFVDLHREVLRLPAHGLGGDGIHLNAYFPNAGVRACTFDGEGMKYGQNVRNLLNLEALTRVTSVLDGAPPPDVAAPGLAGQGTRADPFLVEGFPFSDWRSTALAGEQKIDRYGGCSAAQDESGPEVLYRVSLTQPATLRAAVFSRGGSDIDVHLLDSTGTSAGCLARDDKVVSLPLAAGTYFFSLDTFVPAGGTARRGEYLFVLTRE